MATLFARISNIFAPPVTRAIIQKEIHKMRVRLIEANTHVIYYRTAIQELTELLEKTK